VLGVDLGTRVTAAVLVPLDWAGDWTRVQHVTCGEPLGRDATDAQRARRTEAIARLVVDLAESSRWVRIVAYIESYGYSQRTAAHTLGELGGVVRLELLRRAVELRTANMGSARKFLLGKVPRKGQDAKEEIRVTLRAAGAPADPFESLDVCDAFTAANWGLAELGAYALAQSAR
jgi:hypothetical protein